MNTKTTTAFEEGASKDGSTPPCTFAEKLSNTGLYESEIDVINNMDSLEKEIRDWLQSNGFEQAEVLMDLMLKHRKGQFRNDDVTPEALHELTQAVHFISAIEDGFHVDEPEGVMSLIFAHDLGEDFGMTPGIIGGHLRKNGIKNEKAIESFMKSVDIMSKSYGVTDKKYKLNKEFKIKDHQYFLKIQQDKNASIAKLFDRSQNIMTLIGAKDANKMHHEIGSTEVLINDFIKDVCEKFPSQKDLYIAMKETLKIQMQIGRYLITDTGKPLPDNEEVREAMPANIFKHMPNGLNLAFVPAERVRATDPKMHGPPTCDTVINNKPLLTGDISNLTH